VFCVERSGLRPIPPALWDAVQKRRKIQASPAFVTERTNAVGPARLQNRLARANLARIPDTLSDDAAVYRTALTLLSIGLVAAEHADIPIDRSVAIFAEGPVGLMATVGARLRGAGLVIAVESIPERQKLAKHYGADHVIDHQQVDAVGAIVALTEGQGLDAAIEALGARRHSKRA